MKMKQNILIYIAVIVSLLMSCLSLFYSTQGEWVCVAKECTEWVTGDKWVARFCKPNEEKTDLICAFSLNDKNYQIPLSQLDANTLKSCVEDRCAVGVYVKQVRR